MKFSTRIDTNLHAERLFDIVGNFHALERLLIRRGGSVARIDPSNDPDISLGWNIEFEWRGKARRLRLAVTWFDRPDQMMLAGHSETLDLTVVATVVALTRTKSRLISETEIRPRNMKARLMLQTAKLGKAQLDRRYQRLIGDYVQQMQIAQEIARVSDYDEPQVNSTTLRAVEAR